MCYSIYLIHFQLIRLLWRGTDQFVKGGLGGALLLQLLLIVPLILLASAVFFVVIERPCMQRDWPRKLTARLGLSRDGVHSSASPDSEALPVSGLHRDRSRAPHGRH
jgi:peptidoglycan/LPS O-acetylase OafA/YrhL